MRAQPWSWDKLEQENLQRFHVVTDTALLPKPLIFDVGFNSGEDAIAYLRAGYRVVAVEANAHLAQVARNRSPFYEALADGSLVLMNKAIVTAESGVNSVHFYINPERDVVSSLSLAHCRKAAGSRFAKSCVKTEVPSITCASLMVQYGVPLMIKVDIEGFDYACTGSMATFVKRNGPASAPGYVSAESLGFAEVQTMLAAGYTGIKCSQNKTHVSSGPFGEQVDDWISGRRWRNLSVVLLQQASLRPLAGWSTDKWLNKASPCPRRDIHFRHTNAAAMGPPLLQY